MEGDKVECSMHVKKIESISNCSWETRHGEELCIVNYVKGSGCRIVNIICVAGEEGEM
jgi:hypothetical protein